MQISFIRNSLSYWTASDVIQDGNTHLRKLAGCDVNLPLLRCVCMCVYVCVCARADGPAARAAVSHPSMGHSR